MPLSEAVSVHTTEEHWGMGAEFNGLYFHKQTVAGSSLRAVAVFLPDIAVQLRTELKLG